MMDLWHCADARSFRPLWMLEEMGLPYTLHLLPFPPRWQQPDYLAINPLGTIPFLKDGAAELTESSGILHYLAAKHGPTPLAVTPDEADFALYTNYLFQSDATFTFPQTLVLRYRLLEPPEKRQPAVADAYAKWFLSRMGWVETHLADGREWLAAGRFTAADIAVGYACLLAGTLGLLADLGPETRGWWGRCTARDGYRRARAAQSTPAA
ncbi:glutathione S-transferase family protein [Sandaracinobacter neustonicus]|uniref:Glutathione S-transferase family protein n=1 Tax=Sandaracinobacter neustonicus TaxID=1715348 RepID=A0A501XRM7_9SPHN|nr:glutathione S-transferase family protein [Sandaracinobacter neustonicus]TPE63321.1 glutathione S-transferase family protein [Sandaracinobacter neustonicus]